MHPHHTSMNTEAPPLLFAGVTADTSADPAQLLHSLFAQHTPQPQQPQSQNHSPLPVPLGRHNSSPDTYGQQDDAANNQQIQAALYPNTAPPQQQQQLPQGQPSAARTRSRNHYWVEDEEDHRTGSGTATPLQHQQQQQQQQSYFPQQHAPPQHVQSNPHSRSHSPNRSPPQIPYAAPYLQLNSRGSNGYYFSAGPQHQHSSSRHDSSGSHHDSGNNSPAPPRGSDRDYTPEDMRQDDAEASAYWEQMNSATYPNPRGSRRTPGGNSPLHLQMQMQMAQMQANPYAAINAANARRKQTSPQYSVPSGQPSSRHVNYSPAGSPPPLSSGGSSAGPTPSPPARMHTSSNPPPPSAGYAYAAPSHLNQSASPYPQMHAHAPPYQNAPHNASRMGTWSPGQHANYGGPSSSQQQQQLNVAALNAARHEYRQQVEWGRAGSTGGVGGGAGPGANTVPPQLYNDDPHNQQQQRPMLSQYVSPHTAHSALVHAYGHHHPQQPPQQPGLIHASSVPQPSRASSTTSSSSSAIAHYSPMPLKSTQQAASNNSPNGAPAAAAATLLTPSTFSPPVPIPGSAEIELPMPARESSTGSSVGGADVPSGATTPSSIASAHHGVASPMPSAVSPAVSASSAGTGGGGGSANVARPSRGSLNSMPAISNLPDVDSDDEMAHISSWLAEHGFTEYIPLFLHHQVSLDQLVHECDEADLKSMGIEALGVRKKIIKFARRELLQGPPSVEAREREREEMMHHQAMQQAQSQAHHYAPHFAPYLSSNTDYLHPMGDRMPQTTMQPSPQDRHVSTPHSCASSSPTSPRSSSPALGLMHPHRENSNGSSSSHCAGELMPEPAVAVPLLLINTASSNSSGVSAPNDPRSGGGGSGRAGPSSARDRRADSHSSGGGSFSHPYFPSSGGGSSLQAPPHPMGHHPNSDLADYRGVVAAERDRNSGSTNGSGNQQMVSRDYFGYYNGGGNAGGGRDRGDSGGTASALGVSGVGGGGSGSHANSFLKVDQKDFLHARSHSSDSLHQQHMQHAHSRDHRDHRGERDRDRERDSREMRDPRDARDHRGSDSYSHSHSLSTGVPSNSIAHLPLHISFLQASPLLHSESPGRSHALNIDKETEALRDSLAESGRAFRVRFAIATKDNLLKLLTKGTRALHISGHGDPHHLILENGLGGVEALDQNILRNLLIVGGSELSFVFISSCFSYRAAVAFLAAGVKHVIAVQEDTAVSDTSARAFAAHVYLALCQGRSVKEAFHKGQAAVLASNSGHRNKTNEACCCAHLHVATCKVCEECRSPLCCAVHAAPCHTTTSCCSPAIPHGESLKFLLLPPEDPLAGITHDVRIFDDVTEGGWVNLTPPKPPNNLPSVDHFTGRAEQVYNVCQIVLTSRLTTITGLKGIGKSALARAVGTYVNDRRHFEHGVFLIRLGMLTQGWNCGADEAAARARTGGPAGAGLAALATSGMYAHHAHVHSHGGGHALGSHIPGVHSSTHPLNIPYELNIRIAKAMGLDFTRGGAHASTGRGSLIAKHGGAAGPGTNHSSAIPSDSSEGAAIPTSSIHNSLHNHSLPPEDLGELLHAFLKSRHLLLILDDTDDLLMKSQYRPEFKAWIKQFLDQTSHTSLIVTANLYQALGPDRPAAGANAAAGNSTAGNTTGSSTGGGMGGVTGGGGNMGSGTIGRHGLDAIGIPGHTSKLYQLGPLHVLDSVVLLIHRFPRELRPEEYGRMRNVDDFAAQPIMGRLRGNPRLLEWAAELLNHVSLEQLTNLVCHPVEALPVGHSHASVDLSTIHPDAFYARQQIGSIAVTAGQATVIAERRMDWIQQQNVWHEMSGEAQILVRKLVQLLESATPGAPPAAAAATASSSAVSASASPPVHIVDHQPSASSSPPASLFGTPAPALSSVALPPTPSGPQVHPALIAAVAASVTPVLPSSSPSLASISIPQGPPSRVPSPIDPLSNVAYAEALLSASSPGARFQQSSPLDPILQFGSGAAHSQQRPLVYGAMAPQSELQQPTAQQHQHVNLSARMEALQLQQQQQQQPQHQSSPGDHPPHSDPQLAPPSVWRADSDPVQLMPRPHSSVMLAIADSGESDTEGYDASAAVLSPRISGQHGDSRFARMQ